MVILAVSVTVKATTFTKTTSRAITNFIPVRYFRQIILPLDINVE